MVGLLKVDNSMVQMHISAMVIIKSPREIEQLKRSNVMVAEVGFSFGARVITRLGCSEPPTRLIIAGFPTRGMDTTYLQSCPVEKFFIQSTHDEHGPKVELEQLFKGFSEPKSLIWIPARDHFFEGGLEELEQAVLALRQSEV